jgi:hypothetical protein
MAVLVAGGSLLFGVSFGDSPLGLALVLATFALAVGSLATLLPAAALSGFGLVFSLLGARWLRLA